MWRRLRALTAADRRLLAETGLLLLVVRIGLKLLPFRVVRRLSVGIRPSGREPDPEFPGRVTWAVAALGRRLPGATCLVQSLAAHALLRRAGHHAEIHIGVRAREDDAAGSLAAHAWVECDGRIVAGDVGDLPEYRVLQPAGPQASSAPAGAP